MLPAKAVGAVTIRLRSPCTVAVPTELAAVTAVGITLVTVVAVAVPAELANAEGALGVTTAPIETVTEAAVLANAEGAVIRTGASSPQVPLPHVSRPQPVSSATVTYLRYANNGRR